MHQEAPLTEAEAEALLASLEAALAEELREEGAPTPSHPLRFLPPKGPSSKTLRLTAAVVFRCAEAAALAEYEAAVAAEDAAAAAAAAEHAAWAADVDASGEAPVPCPVCGVRRLLCLRGVVCCACGGIRLDLSAEGGTLAHVRDALAAAWAAHAANGCARRPQFSQRSDFGAAALWAHCDECRALIAVL